MIRPRPMTSSTACITTMLGTDGSVDPNECHVGVYLSENEDNRIDTVVAYSNHGSLFDPARPWLNRAGIRPRATLRQLLAAFRLTLDDVECWKQLHRADLLP